MSGTLTRTLKAVVHEIFFVKQQNDNICKVV